MTVHNFLITGDDRQILSFAAGWCSRLNLIERRGQTCHYTCMGEDRDPSLAFARELGLTVQELHDGEWPVVVQGTSEPWQKDKPAAAIDPACPSLQVLGDIQRLALKAGDVVVIRTPRKLSQSEMAYIKLMVEALFPGHGVLVLDTGLDLGIVSNEEDER